MLLSCVVGHKSVGCAVTAFYGVGHSPDSVHGVPLHIVVWGIVLWGVLAAHLWDSVRASSCTRLMCHESCVALCDWLLLHMHLSIDV